LFQLVLLTDLFSEIRIRSVIDDLAAQVIEFKRHVDQAFKSFLDARLTVRLHEKQHKPAAAGA
jgi:hypothetical protein